MIKTFIKVKYILIVLLFAVASFGQHNKVKFYTVNDGLSQNSVQAVFQDFQGYLWVGTEDGLNRFNGYEFKKFYNVFNDSNSLIYQDITSIIEPSFQKGIIWIGTRNGLSRYDKGNDIFHNYYFDNCDSVGAGFNEIISLRESKYFPETIWIATRNGIIKFSANDYSHERLLANCADANFSSCVEIGGIIESENFLWLASSAGLIKYNLENNSYKIYRAKDLSLERDAITCIQSDENAKGKLWFGNESNAIYSFDVANESVKRYEFSVSNKERYIATGFITPYDKYLVVGTSSSGLRWFDRENERFDYKPYNDDEYLLSTQICSDFWIDRSNILWVASQGGLLKLNPLNEKFQKVEKLHKENINITENDVWAFCQDKMNENIIWIGTDNGGIVKFDYIQSKFVEPEPIFRKINYRHSIFSLEHGDDNVLWVGTFDGLLKVDLGKNSYKWFKKGKGNKGLTDPRVLANKYSKENENLLYIATVNGFNILNTKTENFEKYTTEEDGKKLSAPVVNCIFESDRNPGIVWIGTENGFNKYISKEKRIVNFSPESKTNKFPGKFILSITEDESNPNFLWITADNLGLVKFNISQEKIENIYSLKEGLPNKTVYGVLQYNNYLWLSSNSGISRFDYKNKTFRNFSVEDGLQGNEFNLGAYFKTNNNFIFFGGVNGFNYFHPEELSVNFTPPKVVIEEVKILNRNMDFNNCLREPLTIKLSYSDNMISFYFAGLEFSAPEKNRYKFMLQGFHNDWVDNGSERSVTFTNLDPGEYLLKIKAANGDGVWSEKTTDAKIIIDPAFWMTWWFKAFVGIFLFANIFVFVYLKLQKPLELERLRMKIARDLHDEVGSSLTKISMTAGLLRFDSDEKRNAARIETLDVESRSIITSMSDVIWSIDARNNTIGDLIDRMKNHAFKLFENIDLEVTFVENISNLHSRIKIDIRQNIYLIFKEAVNNAVKYSGSSNIEVKIENSKATGFILEVIDFGKGLPKDMKFTGNGLRNMRARAENIGGKIEFLSENGLTVRFKMKYV